MYRPAWRISHTGVLSASSPRATRTSSGSWASALQATGALTARGLRTAHRLRWQLLGAPLTAPRLTATCSPAKDLAMAVILVCHSRRLLVCALPPLWKRLCNCPVSYYVCPHRLHTSIYIPLWKHSRTNPPRREARAPLPPSYPSGVRHLRVQSRARRRCAAAAPCADTAPPAHSIWQPTHAPGEKKRTETSAEAI